MTLPLSREGGCPWEAEAVSRESVSGSGRDGSLPRQEAACNFCKA